MSGLVGVAKDVASGAMDSASDLMLGTYNVSEVFSNLTLFSLIVTALRGNVVKGRTSFDEAYDYIIIGGGTAGSIMASRLSQHPCVKVLLLEAGGEQPVFTSVPGFTRIFLGTDIDWSYFTAPQNYSSFGQKENRVLWNSGKVLGGSSVINSMLYVRGNKHNFNQWARGGAEGWSYDEVLPYFLKLEDNHNIEELDEGYHSQEGPMAAEKPKYNPDLKKRLSEALIDLGYPMTDVNGKRQFGVYDLQGTVRNQERCSTATAYLKPASKRHNLHIVTNAFVRKVLINRKAGNRAYGVVFEHEGKPAIVRIKKSDHIRGGFGEIIVANGATRTPQTLMLSGIGPKEHLQQLGISVVSNLPVGKNLMDHYAGALLYEYEPLQLNGAVKLISPENIAAYVVSREGPLTSISQNMLLAFLNGLNNTNPKFDFPMQQMYFMEYNTVDGVRTLNLKPDVEAKVFTPYLLKPTMYCWSQLLQPHSRGEITLNSIDPHEFPHINPNYYSDPRDVQIVVKGMEICNAVARHPAMQKLKMKWVATQEKGFPGCESFEGDVHKYYACIAKSIVITIWHPTGTARMGDPSDPRSVVDPQLRVIGVKNLRVINAAIMPIITSGNTNVPTMMIAEKGYDMMKSAILCPSTHTIRGSQQVRDHN